MKDKNPHLSNLQPQKCHSHTQTRYFEVLYSDNIAHRIIQNTQLQKKRKKEKEGNKHTTRERDKK